MSASAARVCVCDYEREAAKKLAPAALGFFNSGADGEQTLAENVAAFKRVRLRPRCLVDVSSISVRQTVQGKEVGVPIGVAPTALQKMAHSDGECAAARAAQELGAIYTLSCVSTCSMEEVAAAAPSGIKWFQLYVFRDRELTASLVRRAEMAGFSALVVTIDAPLPSKRLIDERNGGLKVPEHLRLANFPEHLSNMAKGANNNNNTSWVATFVNTVYDPSLTWEAISWLRGVTSLPIIVKGVMTSEDALRAVDVGCSGIIVSNHGGRQLDGCISTLEALPAIVAAVKARCEVYMDGGVRKGTDVLKAVALGAKYVFVGRPILWGLAVDGEEGAKHVLQLLIGELRLAMGLCGVTRVSDLDRRVIERFDVGFGYSTL